MAGAVTTGGKGWLRLQGTDFLVDDATFAQFKQGYEESAKSSDGNEQRPELRVAGHRPAGAG